VLHPSKAYTPTGSRVSAHKSNPPLAPSRRAPRKEVAMRVMLEITSEGDIIDDGVTYALFELDPESLGDDPLE
jgi:hypothetical protein